MTNVSNVYLGESARPLIERGGALSRGDAGSGACAGAESAMVKLFLSESFVESSLDTMSIHGGLGYMTDSEIERDLRDAVGARIYSGTSDIQRNIIAGYMGL